jgi:Mn2+/Fe2+ NRAMP family transporter
VNDDHRALTVLNPSGTEQAGSHPDRTRSTAPRGWRYYLRSIGPGLVTGASDDDPSGIATYSQAGAMAGLGLLWTSLLTFPLMGTVQEICNRTALATGKNLGELITSRWRSRPARAAKTLQPIAGPWAGALFALGFIGSGMLAIPVLAGSGAAAGLAGLLGKRFGFSRSPRQAPVFYGLVALGTIGGTALTLTHVDPVQLLVISAFINGVAAAPFLVLVMLISGNRKLMGEHANGRFSTVVGWLTAVIMAVAAIVSLAVG